MADKCNFFLKVEDSEYLSLNFGFPDPLQKVQFFTILGFQLLFMS